MMNHCVPNFQEIEDDFLIPTSSGLSRPKRPAIGQEDIMELLWQNGQVVAQTQKLSKKTQLGVEGGDAAIPAEQREIRLIGEDETTSQQHLFIQEDEMASWLQYPLDVSSFDRDLYADLLYSAPPPSTPIATVAPPRPAAEIRPPPLPQRSPIAPQNHQRLQNFLHISRIPNRAGAGHFLGQSVSSVPAGTARESAVVDSNETPVTGPKSNAAEDCKANIPDMTVRTGAAPDAGDLAATISSSPSCSGASFSTSVDRMPAPQKPPPETVDRKRKGRETDYNKGRTEDIEFEATECRKQARGSTSTKKSRAAEVHNLSERRRRDRINEKMRVLQELIPRCNKSDKASMLDEAIEYLKSLQLQVQMMSMGCGMVPMIYPGMQQYQYMPMMGMGMDMSMNRPMVPYPSMLPGSALPNPAAAAHMSPCFPMPAFHLPSVPVPDPSKIQVSNQTDPMLNAAVAHNSNQPRMPNFNNPCQQFFSLHQSQPPLPQNQAVVQPNTKQPSSRKDIGNPDNPQSGSNHTNYTFKISTGSNVVQMNSLEGWR